MTNNSIKIYFIFINNIKESKEQFAILIVKNSYIYEPNTNNPISESFTKQKNLTIRGRGHNYLHMM
jgi:hypothetical protein